MSSATGTNHGLFSELIEQPAPESVEDVQAQLMSSWLACGCPFCLAAAGGGGATPGAFATTPTGNFSYVAPSATQGQGVGIDALMAGSKWSSQDTSTAQTIITYSFSNPASSTYAYSSMAEFTQSITAFSDADKALTRTLLHSIEAVCNVQFVEVADDSTQCGVIRYAYSPQPNALNFAGYAFFPSSGAQGGDVWIGAQQSTPTWDFYRPDLILHETLHALGLKHPFDPGTVLSTAQDIIPNTVMSYSPVAGGTAGYMSDYPSEPMPLDIAALQSLYGAAATNTGDTTYDLSSPQYQGFNALWDAGGTDTLDASRLGHGVTLDLHGGASSDIGAAVSAMAKAAGGTTITTTYTSTFSIATGAVIEDAIGSAYADRITGNDVANRIDGGGGNDTIDGAGGLDTVVVDESRGASTIAQTGGGYLVWGAAGTDTLANVERVQFTDVNVALDLAGNAGTAAKMLGVIAGNWATHDATLMGLGIHALDGGMSVADLMHAALDARLGAGASNEAVVKLLLANMTGTDVPEGVVHDFTQLLDNGSYTPTGLALVAMDHPLNLVQVDLAGLAATGVEFI